MEIRLPIRSRIGNAILLAIGVGFLIAASAILVYAVVTTWGFAGVVDRMLQMLLLACAGFGAYLAIGARRNLGREALPHFRRRRA